MLSPQLYDHIGAGYRDYRRPDPRIAAVVMDALGGAKTVINIGASAGSYEPRDRFVIAVEPSETIIQQRPETARLRLLPTAPRMAAERAALANSSLITAPPH